MTTTLQRTHLTRRADEAISGEMSTRGAHARGRSFANSMGYETEEARMAVTDLRLLPPSIHDAKREAFIQGFLDRYDELHPGR